MHYYITYDDSDKIIWGAGLSPEESFKDALKQFTKYLTDTQTIGASDFATLDCTKQTYEHISKYGFIGDEFNGLEADKWVYVLEVGKAMMYEEMLEYKGLSKAKLQNGANI